MRKKPRVDQLYFHHKTVFAYHPWVSAISDPPGNVVRVDVAACLWPTTFNIPSVGPFDPAHHPPSLLPASFWCVLAPQSYVLEALWLL